jgi:hypothetical protein
MQLLTDLAVTALKDIPLTNHKDVRLGLSVTQELCQGFCNQLTMAKIPIEHIAERLRHLSVEFCGHEGNSGDLNETSSLPAAKSEFSNMICSFQTFRLVELAKNLDTLYLRSIETFNLEGLNLGHFRNLHALYLARVAISAESLLSLVEGCKESLKRIALERVELNSGTWETVLIRMSQLPSLRYIYIDGVGYSTTGKSSHLVPRKLPLVGDLEEIRTSNPLDHQARAHLERQINANRRAAQLLEFPEDCFRYTKLEPLKKLDVPAITDIQ